MLKSILTFVLFVSFCAVNAQTDTSTQHSPLKREKFRLAVDMPNSPVLKKDELKLMLPQKQFRGYNHARRCYIASIPLLSIGTGFFAAGIVMTIDASISTRDNMLSSYTFAVYTGCAAEFLIPGIILITYSKNKLNSVAEDYNSQHTFSYQPVKLNLGFVGNGIGLKLTF